MSTIKINIARDFSDAPGARYRKDGEKSGEEFYEEILHPKFQEAIEKDIRLFIDMDNTWGYPSSFISGSFGRLSHQYGKDLVKDHLELKSDDDKSLITLIKKEIDNPNYSDS